MQNLTIVMTTYNPPGTRDRFNYANRCIDGFFKYLMYEPEVKFIIADDGSDPKLLELLCKHIGNKTVYTRTERKGIGGSLNKALDYVTTPYFMFTTDDWLLRRTLDLAQALQLLQTHSLNYTMVRLGPLHPNLKCWTMFNREIGWWLDVDCSEGYAFATRPFVAKTQWFQDNPFDENLDAYETERMYSDKFQKQMRIAAYPDISGACWKHIGEYEVGHIDPKLS